MWEFIITDFIAVYIVLNGKHKCCLNVRHFPICQTTRSPAHELEMNNKSAEHGFSPYGKSYSISLQAVRRDLNRLNRLYASMERFDNTEYKKTARRKWMPAINPYFRFDKRRCHNSQEIVKIKYVQNKYRMLGIARGENIFWAFAHTWLPCRNGSPHTYALRLANRIFPIYPSPVIIDAERSPSDWLWSVAAAFLRMLHCIGSTYSHCMHTHADTPNNDFNNELRCIQVRVWFECILLMLWVCIICKLPSNWIHF